MAKEGYKVCAKCKTEQSVTQFCKSSKAADGLQSYCRVCSSASSNWSHGQKRSDMQDLRKTMDEGELEYRYAVTKMKRKHEKEFANLKKKYETGGFSASDEPEGSGGTPAAAYTGGLGGRVARATEDRLAIMRQAQKLRAMVDNNGETDKQEESGTA